MANNVTIKDFANADAVIATRDKGPSLGEVQYVQIDLGGAGAITPAEGTLPVSATALPLPSGAATAANQATEIAALGAPTDAEAAGDGPVIALLKRLRTLLGSVLQVRGTRSNAGTDAASGASHLTVGGSNGTNLYPLLTDSAGRLFVNINGTVPLPTGAATQTTLAAIDTKLGATLTVAGAVTANAGANLNTSALALESGGNLAALVARTPALGQAAPAASQPVVLSNDQGVTGGAGLSAINVDLLTGTTSGWFDAATFHSVAIQIVASSGISAGAIIFEQTNDTTAAAGGNVWPVEEDTSLTPTPNVAAVTIAASTTRMFRGQVTARYVRARISTAFVGGSVQAVAVFSQMPFVRMTQTVHQATAANLNTNVSGSVTATLAAAAVLAADVGTQYRGTATGAGTATAINSPATPVGQTLKGAAGRLLGMRLTNTGAAARFVKFFNATAVTPGTTAAAFEVALPVNGSADITFEGGIAFGAGIMIMVTGARGLTNNTVITLDDVTGFTVHA